MSIECDLHDICPTKTREYPQRITCQVSVPRGESFFKIGLAVFVGEGLSSVSESPSASASARGESVRFSVDGDFPEVSDVCRGKTPRRDSRRLWPLPLTRGGACDVAAVCFSEPSGKSGRRLGDGSGSGVRSGGVSNSTVLFRFDSFSS